MKVGDLVRSTDKDDAVDVGIIIGFPSSGLARYTSRKVLVYWPEPTFGDKCEWDWERDLELVSESR